MAKSTPAPDPVAIQSPPKPTSPTTTVSSARTAGSAAAGVAKPAKPAAPRVVWDDSTMRTSYANVCNVLGTREEITLLFGSNQTWQPGQEEVRVILSDRVVLNPYAAKRLYALLDKGIKEYEGRFGELKI